jgi:hypothetical protein
MVVIWEVVKGMHTTYPTPSFMSLLPGQRHSATFFLMGPQVHERDHRSESAVAGLLLDNFRHLSTEEGANVFSWGHG